MRFSPSKAGDRTVARKWSPPPVQSSTSALLCGSAASMRCLISSVVGICLEGIAILCIAMTGTTVSYQAKGVRFTDKGAEKVREFLDSQGADVTSAGLRVGVRGGGCSGFQYQLAFDDHHDGDAIFEDQGLRILVDAQS